MSRVLCALCHTVPVKDGAYCRKHSQEFIRLAKLDAIEEFAKLVDTLTIPMAKEIAKAELPFNAMLALRARRHKETGRLLIHIQRIG